MNIWILNHHALTPNMSGGTRHYDFAKELVKRGHAVTIVASSFHYSKYTEMKEHQDNQTYILETIDNIDFIWLKTPPYKGNGVGRVKSMISYMSQSIRLLPRLDLAKPDIIIGSSVHLFAVYSAHKLSKTYDVPFVMEVRDLWPQTLIDMGISKWHPFVILLGVLEKYLYKKADKIITNLPFAYQYIQTKGIDTDKITWISNGVDLDNIIYKPKQKTKQFVVSYTGSIGIANNLDTLLDVAKKFDKQNDIVFNIVGAGPLKNTLLKRIENENIKNTTINAAVPKSQVHGILTKSDILYVGLKDSPLYKYGMSMNKVFDYMGTGRPIVFSSNSVNNPIADGNCGLTTHPNNTDELYDAIVKLHDMSQDERDQLGLNGHEYAKMNFSIQVLVDKLENLLTTLTNESLKKENSS